MAIDGKAQIAQAGWALPVAVIDVNQPTEAAGIGALAVNTKAGLTLGWRGLRSGPAQLVTPWVVLAPGLIFIIDVKASCRYGRQRLRLWQDDSSKFRSEIDLAFTNSFAVVYTAASSGNELLLAQTNAEARLDRPVDVAGTPFPIRTLGSLLALAYSDADQLVSLYDDNILVDSLDAKATWPVEPGQAISLAIRNALFTVTPVNSLLLFARLRDEEMIERAVLLLGMGLFGLLPTLPDPYAANVGWLRRQSRGDQRFRRPSMLLVTGVTWQKAATDDAPDKVDTAFAFAPLGAQAQTIETWQEGAKAVQAASRPRQAARRGEPTGARHRGGVVSRRVVPSAERRDLVAAVPGIRTGAVRAARRLVQCGSDGREFRMVQRGRGRRQLHVLSGLSAARRAGRRVGLSAADPRSRSERAGPLRARLHGAADQLGRAVQRY